MGAPGLGETPRSWSATFDAMNDMVCLLDRDGMVVRCNRSMEEFLGSGPDEITGKKCYEVMHGSHTFFDRSAAAGDAAHRPPGELRARPRR